MLNKEEKLEFIDHFFAASCTNLTEEQTLFLAALFALLRQGHLSLDLDPLSFPPPALQNLLLPASIESVRRGAETFPVGPPPAWVCRFGTHYYLQKSWVYETEVIQHLERLHHASPTVPLSLPLLDSHLKVEQMAAIQKGIEQTLSLLTGGPGTGKTFTAAQLAQACLDALPEERKKSFHILLTAPTGKAVAQLESNLRRSLGEEMKLRAGTLHALLGLKKYGDADEKISPLFADLILVDECSMIDPKLFVHLLSAIPTGTRVVLIGDKDQLSAVEGGSFFADILDAQVYPATELKESLRSDRQEILTFARHIKEGNAQDAISLLQTSTDLHWYPLDKTTSMQLWQQWKTYFPSPQEREPEPQSILEKIGKFSLLSCKRQGPLGVDSLNQHFLYQACKEIPLNHWWIAPIMINRNDYELNLFNGDCGILIRQITSDFSVQRLTMDDYALFHDRKGGYRKIGALALKSFEYSYCLSVHKSQGSEYDTVCILMPQGSDLFGKEVLYTAVTRARRKITLAASEELLKEGIQSTSRKQSGLKSRLQLKWCAV